MHIVKIYDLKAKTQELAFCRRGARKLARIVWGGNCLLDEVPFGVVREGAVLPAILGLPQAPSPAKLLLVGLRFTFLKNKGN